MLKKILVAVDSSTMSRIVFEQALHLAQQNQASLMLLHILSPTQNLNITDHI